jgi:hypothetical protein
MATKANIVIDQNATFNTEIDLTDENGNLLDLNGYTANSQIRRWYTSTNAAATFTVNLQSGAIFLSLTADSTANLVYGRYVYDVILTDPQNNKTRVVEGIVTVTPGVTK